MNSPSVLWFVVGSQHLYGPSTLETVRVDAQQVAASLSSNARMPLPVEFRALVTTPEEILGVCREAGADERCAGLIFWMHTFSPAKMWIAGLKALTKPFCHLHTQFQREIPWETIDMDYMNLHQSAHGDREFGFVCSRLGLERRVIVGHWEDNRVIDELASWGHVVLAWQESQRLRVVRFGDNMRHVAVTEGDKVEAQSVFGFEVNTHGVGDLVDVIRGQSDGDVDALTAHYADTYTLAAGLERGGARHGSLREAARIELGLRAFLKAGGYGAFTDTFEDLHGLEQLPGLPVQRLMADGYGFGAEGDWKHAALLRVMKVLAGSHDAGTSFMEDYTDHWAPDSELCLGAHMLEICPSIAAGRPSCEIHPLGIGGKADPVRLVFDGKTGPAVNISLVDMGNRFRLIVAVVDAVSPPASLPRLPVARVLWSVRPSMETGVAAWIHAGGAHHTVFSYSVSVDQVCDFAAMAGVECIVIDENTNLRSLRQELRWNAAASRHEIF